MSAHVFVSSSHRAIRTTRCFGIAEDFSLGTGEVCAAQSSLFDDDVSPITALLVAFVACATHLSFHACGAALEPPSREIGDSVGTAFGSSPRLSSRSLAFSSLG